ncbi:MAG: M48 family metalloprotease [Chlamydiota bacterium]
MAILATGAHANPQKNFHIDLDHTEHLTRLVTALTIDPLKNILHYIFPVTGAYSANYLQMFEDDPAQAAMMPQAPKALILRELKELTACAGIKRSVIPYASLSHHFDSCGGTFSVTSPSLLLPYHRLFRPGKSPFGQERPEENLPNDPWFYSDDETRFLVARELGHIKQNDVLPRIVIKVAVLAAFFFIYTSPLGWIAGSLLIIGALGIYIFLERCFQGRMDKTAVEIVGKRVNCPRRATESAIRVLEKMRAQNLVRRGHSKLACLYITKLGNNVLDFSNPFLTTRIAGLKRSLSTLPSPDNPNFSLLISKI